jgi:hypothetical protein
LRQWAGILVFGTVQVFNECIDDNALIENPMEDPAVPSADPKYVMQWWGPKGLYCARLSDGFSRWRKTSLLHEGAGWAGVLECG